MSSHPQMATYARAKPRLRGIVISAATVALIAAMALDTKIVKIDSPMNIAPNAFSPAAFGAAEFPKVKSAVEERAVSAVTLAEAVAKDVDAAIKQYGLDPSKSGVAASTGTVFCVKFTGVVGKGEAGEYVVNVDGAPSTLVIRVQTGPAIYGTDLRDATGLVSFQQFDNQIDYQKVGSALNNETKKQVLAKVDTKALTGKTVFIAGAFKLSNPNNWLVTPVKLDVQ